MEIELLIIYTFSGSCPTMWFSVIWFSGNVRKVRAPNIRFSHNRLRSINGTTNSSTEVKLYVFTGSGSSGTNSFADLCGAMHAVRNFFQQCANRVNPRQSIITVITHSLLNDVFNLKASVRSTIFCQGWWTLECIHCLALNRDMLCFALTF